MNNNENLKIELKVKANNGRLVANKNAFFIEGGGTKGIYAIGILKYLFDENPCIDLNNVDIFGGTSVGSYLATALSIGYQKEDIIGLSKIINLSELIDSKYMFMVTLYRFTTSGYLYNDEGRQDIVQKILNYRINTIKEHLDLPANSNFNGKDLTFGHLKKLMEKHPTIYKHLLINAVDISRNQQIFMSTLDNKWDNIKIYDAMLASSSIPFIFKGVTLNYQPDDDMYTYTQTHNSTINNLVDGGVSTNNPLDYFLLNNDQFIDYNLWLIKFTNHPKYVKIDGTITLLKQLAEYLISGKNDVKMDLVEEHYKINCINLHSCAGTLDIYTPDEVQKIIENVYEKCVSGKLYFGD